MPENIHASSDEWTPVKIIAELCGGVGPRAEWWIESDKTGHGTGTGWRKLELRWQGLRDPAFGGTERPVATDGPIIRRRARRDRPGRRGVSNFHL